MKQFSYVLKGERKNNVENKVSKYASGMLKSEFNKYGNTKLVEDYRKLLNEGCLYLPNYYCVKEDYSIFDKLKMEIQSQDRY